MLKSILILIAGIIVMILSTPLAIIALLLQGPGKYAKPNRFGV